MLTEKIKILTGGLVMAFMLMLPAVSLSAQQTSITVTGTVVDEGDFPLEGVAILVKDGDGGNGTVTGADGKYKIDAPAHSTLVFMYLGYEDYEAVVNASGVVNVKMQPDSQALEESVVIGYGSARKKDLTGGVSVVDEDVLNMASTTNLMDRLVGQVAGLTITTSDAAPGSNQSLLIRGQNSLSGSNSPLTYALGQWGEGHNVCYEQNNATFDKTEEYKEDTMKWVTDLYSTTFTKVPLVINYHRHIGAPKGEGEEASPNSDKVLNIALSKGYCLRSDAFGMNVKGWGYNDWERSFVRNWNYKVPVIMEGGYIVSSHSYWKDPAGYRQGYPGDVRQGEYDASKEAKVNMMDFRVGAETESWFTDAFNLVKRFNSEGGYRLYPDKISVPGAVSSGADVTIVHRWRNIGWGYFPNNLQQWNYKYKVAFALLDSDGEPQQVILDQGSEPSEWISGSAYVYTLNTSVEVPAGNYTWAVGIVDTTKDNEAAIDLAVKSDKKVGRWVKIADVAVK